MKKRTCNTFSIVTPLVLESSQASPNSLGVCCGVTHIRRGHHHSAVLVHSSTLACNTLQRRHGASHESNIPATCTSQG